MTDYSQGKIYVIKSSQTEDIYIGSTKKTLNERISGHKCGYNKWVEDNKNTYVSSYEILKYDDAYIELLEEYPCNTKQELHKKEGEYQRILECVNKQIAGRTNKEWREEHNEYDKDYREQNKEHIKEYQKEYREQNKEYQKEYRENNKEELKEYQREYQREYSRKIMKCVCGKEFATGNRSRHMKSKVHIKYIEDMKEMGDQQNLDEFFEQFKFKI